MYNVEDVSSSYMDKDSEYVYIESQNVPQSGSRKSFEELILLCYIAIQ